MKSCVTNSCIGTVDLSACRPILCFDNLTLTLTLTVNPNFSLLFHKQPETNILQLVLLHPFNGIFSRTTWVSGTRKVKPVWLNEARDDGIWGCSGISWAICKQSKPRSTQIATPTPRHPIFYRPGALPDAQPTVSKHWRHRQIYCK